MIISRMLLVFPLLTLIARGADVILPKLVVVISVDQMRADYLVRFRPHFGEGGFRRLLEGGADFRNAHYRHAITQTAPGHALMLSGVHANVHGVIGNEWIDRTSWEMVNSVEDRGSPLVGIDPAEMGPVAAANPAKTGRSPRHFSGTTLGDQLKLRHGEKSKVFTASNKDRSAILLGGKLADAAYWDENGKIVTSRHYRAELPAWVAAFNAERRVHAAFGKTWERLLAPEIYERVQGADDAPGEATEAGLGRTFPRKITGGREAITSAFYTAFDNSPFSAEFLGEFVRRAVVEEQLGRHAATDLLGVSFSQIDALGHNYGPDSHEIMDGMVRLDRVLAALLDCLEREVGLAHCVIVLTADHGVAPLPERVTSYPAGRVRLADLDAAVKRALDAIFGALDPGETWFTRDSLSYHLRPGALAARSVLLTDAAAVVKRALLAQPVIGGVFLHHELAGVAPEGDSVPAMMKRSSNAGRIRDVMFFFKPYFVAKTPTGTNHGLPFDHDTHVPLVFFGAGVPKGAHSERVGIDDLAPTLAPLLGVAVSPLAQGKKLF